MEQTGSSSWLRPPAGALPRARQLTGRNAVQGVVRNGRAGPRLVETVHGERGMVMDLTKQAPRDRAMKIGDEMGSNWAWQLHQIK